MPRVLFYARFASDNQREVLIEDQFRICEEYTQREGWIITATYQDRA